MRNLENLKKQAKLVLRRHRDRYYPVAAQIGAVLPRYWHLSDPEALAARFKLSDAQELVARQQGFESWQALFVYGEPPFYAQVKRDRGLLDLKCVDYPVIDPQLRDRESLLSADMALDTHEEIKQLFLEFQAAGVTLFQTLRKEPWGAKTFIVKDPDGNLLLFAGPAH